MIALSTDCPPPPTPPPPSIPEQNGKGDDLKAVEGNQRGEGGGIRMGLEICWPELLCLEFLVVPRRQLGSLAVIPSPSRTRPSCLARAH